MMDLNIMQIRFITDIHWESGPFNLQKTEEDKDRTLVISGDLAVNDKIIEALLAIAPGFKSVLYVPGNHEYEGANISNARTQLELEISNYPKLSHVYILNTDHVIIDGVRFIGANLWSDFNNSDWFAIHAAKDKVSDFEFIKINRVTPRKFHPADAIKLHEDHKLFIEEMCRIPFDGETVVITHHAPSFKSMDPIWETRLGVIKYIFASNMENTVGYSGAKYWLHGHIHSSKDYMIGDTRVICNPRGNAVWENKNFDPNLILEV